ncbi:MAG: hypothetical protein ACIARR_03325 [Phycisphaerales bacterium JB059]
MGEQDTPKSPEPIAREPRVMLGDLTSGLLWPNLLRATPLSLRTGRIALGLGAWVLILLLGNLNTLWSDKPAFIDALHGMIQRPLGWMGASATALDARGFVAGAIALGDVPRALVETYPVSTFALGLPMIAIWVRLGGAISRSAAEEFCLDRVTPWNEAMRFSLRKWVALFAAVVAPLAVVAVLALLLAVVGLVFAVPVAHLLPAVLYPLFLLLGALAVMITLLWVIGHPMLVPGVACEGTDAFDAVQRAFAYVLARPMRLVLYGALLIVQGVIIFGLASGVIAGAAGFTATTSGAFIGDTPREILTPVPDTDPVSQRSSDAPRITRAGFAQQTDEATTEESDAEASGPIATHGWSRRIVNFWTGALELLLGAFFVSYFFTASTILYLLLRRLCDGQDVAELWMPAPDRG